MYANNEEEVVDYRKLSNELKDIILEVPKENRNFDFYKKIIGEFLKTHNTEAAVLKIRNFTSIHVHPDKSGNVILQQALNAASTERVEEIRIKNITISDVLADPSNKDSYSYLFSHWGLTDEKLSSWCNAVPGVMICVTGFIEVCIIVSFIVPGSVIIIPNIVLNMLLNLEMKLANFITHGKLYNLIDETYNLEDLKVVSLNQLNAKKLADYNEEKFWESVREGTEFIPSLVLSEEEQIHDLTQDEIEGFQHAKRLQTLNSSNNFLFILKAYSISLTREYPEDFFDKMGSFLIRIPEALSIIPILALAVVNYALMLALEAYCYAILGVYALALCIPVGILCAPFIVANQRSQDSEDGKGFTPGCSA